jgi:hypothetical protein
MEYWSVGSDNLQYFIVPWAKDLEVKETAEVRPAFLTGIVRRYIRTCRVPEEN